MTFPAVMLRVATIRAAHVVRRAVFRVRPVVALAVGLASRAGAQPAPASPRTTAPDVAFRLTSDLTPEEAARRRSLATGPFTGWVEVASAPPRAPTSGPRAHTRSARPGITLQYRILDVLDGATLADTVNALWVDAVDARQWAPRARHALAHHAAVECDPIREYRASLGTAAGGDPSLPAVPLTPGAAGPEPGRLVLACDANRGPPRWTADVSEAEGQRGGRAVVTDRATLERFIDAVEAAARAALHDPPAAPSSQSNAPPSHRRQPSGAAAAPGLR